VITFKLSILDWSMTTTQKEMWIICTNNNIKREVLIEANLEEMYAVVISICNLVLKDHVCNSVEYKEIDNNQDTLGLLRCVKKIIYSNGEDDTIWGITTKNY